MITKFMNIKDIISAKNPSTVKLAVQNVAELLNFEMGTLNQLVMIMKAGSSNSVEV